MKLIQGDMDDDANNLTNCHCNINHAKQQSNGNHFLKNGKIIFKGFK